MNFSESLKVALWCGKEEVPGDRVGILRPDSGRRAGVVMFDCRNSLGVDKRALLYYLILMSVSPETEGPDPSEEE